MEKATVKFRFDPETPTTLLWTRHTNDEMEVTILGTSILRTSDRGFRDAFDGAIIRNRLGDIAVWRVEISENLNRRLRLCLPIRHLFPTLI